MQAVFIHVHLKYVRNTTDEFKYDDDSASENTESTSSSDDEEVANPAPLKPGRVTFSVRDVSSGISVTEKLGRHGCKTCNFRELVL